MAWMLAINTIQTRFAGTSTFQPSFMNWSYRMSGNVPINQMNPNRNSSIFKKNHNNGHNPVPSTLSPLSVDGQGASPPQRNSVVANADTITMFTYSARKNIANFSELYAVWKPPTSSDSAAGRSNSGRLV